jgi:hypothetical protein
MQNNTIIKMDPKVLGFKKLLETLTWVEKEIELLKMKLHDLNSRTHPYLYIDREITLLEKKLDGLIGIRDRIKNFISLRK